MDKKTRSSVIIIRLYPSIIIRLSIIIKNKIEETSYIYITSIIFSVGWFEIYRESGSEAQRTRIKKNWKTRRSQISNFYHIFTSPNFHPITFYHRMLRTGVHSFSVSYLFFRLCTRKIKQTFSMKRGHISTIVIDVYL